MNTERIAKCLSEVKQEILDQVKDGKASPTLLHLAQVTIDHLDTTYLWCGNLANVQRLMAQGTEAAAEQAVASKEVDFKGAVSG